MSFRIAVSGKGGSGKTTVSTLTVKYIVSRFRKPVLAVDADPNFTFGEALGVQVGSTIADIREDVLERKDSLPAGMTKERYLEYAIHQTIIEADGFDLITMGRPEGPSCYCYVNNLLRGFLKSVGGDYPFIVIDNEAGMEHLSRRSTDDVDLLLIVSDPTPVGIRSALKISRLARSLPITIRRTILILNRISQGVDPEPLLSRLDELELGCLLPQDTAVESFWLESRSLLDLPENAPIYKILCEFLDKSLNTKED